VAPVAATSPASRAASACCVAPLREGAAARAVVTDAREQLANRSDLPDPGARARRNVARGRERSAQHGD